MFDQPEPFQQGVVAPLPRGAGVAGAVLSRCRFGEGVEHDAEPFGAFGGQLTLEVGGPVGPVAQGQVTMAVPFGRFFVLPVLVEAVGQGAGLLGQLGRGRSRRRSRPGWPPRTGPTRPAPGPAASRSS